MPVRVVINGFGRVGRLVLRVAQARFADEIHVVAVNDLMDAPTAAHLLRYDSVHGRYPGEVELQGETLVVDGRAIAFHREPDPGKLPWAELGVDVVIESSGRFRDKSSASAHLRAGARKVLISAPAKEVDAMVVLGVNDALLRPEHSVVSNASCTTNCLAPLCKLVDERWGIEHGAVHTVHAYTGDQRILDAPHKDLRRARAAAAAIVPTSTGAAAALGKVLPSLAGKLTGMAIRVPVPNGSCGILVAQLKKEATAAEINAHLKAAAGGPLQGILGYTDEPLVHLDIVGDPHSSIVDSLSTAVAGGRLATILAWYDNEAGYANRCVELARKLAS